MKIRTKLAFAMTGLVALSTAALGYGVVYLSQRFNDRDARARTATIENYVEKAARDALLQKDDLALVSYVNFLRTQYPSLALARLSWETPEKKRELTIGEPPSADVADIRTLSIVDPAESSRRVNVTLEIDTKVLREIVTRDERRLLKIILLVALCTISMSLATAFWLALSVTAPLSKLDHLAADIAAGRLGASMEWNSEDEIGRLVRSFNTMSHRLEELDEVKKNFVSSVTHELRSPLGAIESFLVLIDGKIVAINGPDTTQCREYIGRIQTNVQRLSRFINDLLDVAKIEKGKMECMLRPMNLGEVAGEVCLFFAPKAQLQGVNLSHDLAGAPKVMGDPERLRQVLINLVSNGLKFTPEGGRIVIGAEQFREGSRRWIEVQVKDSGKGMEERDLARLFQAFSQGRNSSERTVGNSKGTGLGLYISKSIVEQHGGKIGVTSEPGRGTTISFSLVVA